MNPRFAEQTKSNPIVLLCDTLEELESVQALLRDEGLESLATSSDSEALIWLESQPPSLLVVSYVEIALAEKFIRALGLSCREQQVTAPRGILLLASGLHAQRAHELYRSGLVDALAISRPIADPLGFGSAVCQLLQIVGLQTQLAELSQQFDAVTRELGALRCFLNQAFDEGACMLDASGALPATQWLQQLREGANNRFDKLHGYTAALSESESPALIMVVEDEPTYRTILRTMLESSGYRVIEAADGESAMEALKTSRPDLIILDYVMPRMDGMETLKRIKARPALVDIPVMMLTGLSDKDLVRECVRQGAADFVVKPSSRLKLLAKVQSHLK